MHLTTGFELTTAITNILIFIVSLYGFIKIKNDKLWKLFYFLMAIDSLLGTIVHGFQMSIGLNIIIWIILTIVFTITVNTYLVIFLNIKTKYISILSIVLSIILLIEIYLGIDFLLTFTIYALISIIISIYFIIKNNYKNKKYFLIGIILQIIGGLFMISKIKLTLLNHNGIYHVFMALTMAMFLMGIEKEK